MPTLSLVSEVTGTVWRVVASPGQMLGEDETIVVVESMKMEVPLCAPEDCRLLELMVEEGQMIREGDIVARLGVE